MDDRVDDLHEESVPPDSRDGIEAVRRFLVQTLDDMGLDVSVSVLFRDEEAVLEIVGPDAGLAIGKKGATLDALQVLCNRVLGRAVGTARTHLLLDAAGYRARREQSLATMAQHLGQQCVQAGTVITMDPLSPRERRVVHMALAQFPGVTTRSEGEGEDRRVQIIPVPIDR